MTDWKTIYAQLDIVKRPGRTAPKPTLRAIRDYETRIGFRFPDSYRDYARVFGAGTLAEFFRISVPHGGSLASGGLAAFHEIIDDTRDTLGTWCGDSEFAKRMVVFGGTVGGDLFAWDPNDLRDTDAHEYGIYALADDRVVLRELCGSFAEFVTDICFGTRFFDLLRMKHDGKVPRTFTPYRV